MKLYYRISVIIIVSVFCGQALALGQEALPQVPKRANLLNSKPDFLSPEVTVISTQENKAQEPEKVSEDASLADSAENASGMRIKRLNTKQALYSLELRDVEVRDLFRVLAHDYKLNLLVDKNVSGKVTASLSSVSLEDALDSIAESLNLLMEKKGSIINVTPNLVIKTFVLKYIEAKKVLGQLSSSNSQDTTVQSEASGASASTTITQPSTAATAAESAAVESTGATRSFNIYDLISDKGIILLGQQPNSITVIDYPSNLKRIEEYLSAIDQRMTSRIFKLKFLKAKEIVGAASASSTQTTADTTTSSTAQSDYVSSAGSGTSSTSGQ